MFCGSRDVPPIVALHENDGCIWFVCIQGRAYVFYEYIEYMLPAEVLNNWSMMETFIQNCPFFHIPTYCGCFEDVFACLCFIGVFVEISRESPGRFVQFQPSQHPSLGPL